MYRIPPIASAARGRHHCQSSQQCRVLEAASDAAQVFLSCLLPLLTKRLPAPEVPVMFDLYAGLIELLPAEEDHHETCSRRPSGLSFPSPPTGCPVASPWSAKGQWYLPGVQKGSSIPPDDPQASGNPLPGLH